MKLSQCTDFTGLTVEW